MGPFGIVLLLAFVLYYLLSTDSYGSPLLAPFSPLTAHDLRDTLVKYDMLSLATRPLIFGSRNRTRLLSKKEQKDGH